MAQEPRGAADAFVGHEQRPGGVVAEADGEEMARGFGLQGRGGDDLRDLVRERERGDLPSEGDDNGPAQA